MSELITIIRYEDTEGHLIVERPMIFSRLYAVGQSVVLGGRDYHVRGCFVEGHTQRVVLAPVTLCPACGGIQGKTTPPDEDLCIDPPCTDRTTT